MTEAFVKERLATDATGHDWWHTHRVRNTANELQAIEGGDADIIELAALLHDVGDRKVIQKPEDDYSIAYDFLRSIKVGEATVDAVMRIISTLSFSKSFNSTSEEKPIELKIVQDADRLDALGAIGIARAFAFGGSAGRSLYNPAAEAQVFTSREEYVKSQGDTLHHFDEKLFLLKGTFNTAQAEAIAQQRDAFMHEFYARFLREWDGQA